MRSGISRRQLDLAIAEKLDCVKPIASLLAHLGRLARAEVAKAYRRPPRSVTVTPRPVAGLQSSFYDMKKKLVQVFSADFGRYH